MERRERIRALGRKARRIGVALLVFTGAVGAVALLLEVVLRCVHAAPLVERIYTTSPVPALAYTLQPSLRFAYLTRGKRVVVTTDADGRRVVPGAPPAASRTLHVIGDSQVFGWELADEESIPAQLQLRLGPGWKVVNHGVPGYGPYAYAELLEKVPPDDYALVVLTETNDLRDAMSDRPEAVTRCGFLVSQAPLAQHLPCFVLGSYTFASAMLLEHRWGDTRLLVPLGFEPLGQAAAEVLWFRARNLIAAPAAAHPGRVLTAVIPWDASVVPKRLAFYHDPPAPPAARLVTPAADVDLAAAFRRDPEPDHLFFAADHHLSPAGAAAVAAELAPRVAALVPDARHIAEGRP